MCILFVTPNEPGVGLDDPSHEALGIQGMSPFGAAEIEIETSACPFVLYRSSSGYVLLKNIIIKSLIFPS